MITQPRTLLIASALTVALAAASGAASAAATSQDVTNARQEAQIGTSYALSPHLRANNLKVSVENGQATLTGNVAEAVSKELAGEIAKDVKGITDVNNRIVVVPNYMPPKSAAAPSFGDAFDDASTTATIKSKLLWSKRTDGMTTHVHTQSGRVTLRGTAGSAADRAFAERLTINTRGVRSVDNQLRVEAPKSGVVDSGKRVAGAAGDEIADSWITAKVKSTLLYSSNVTGSAIEVSTDQGVVTLSGKVDNRAEQALAIEYAQNVRGVKSVQAKTLTF